jgi:hypothetical protein
MAPHDQFQRAAWRKSSYSNGATQCTEVARVGTRTAIRDSKNPGGPVLLLTAGQMRTLTHRIKTGQVIALTSTGNHRPARHAVLGLHGADHPRRSPAAGPAGSPRARRRPA